MSCSTALENDMKQSTHLFWIDFLLNFFSLKIYYERILERLLTFVELGHSNVK